MDKLHCYFSYNSIYFINLEIIYYSSTTSINIISAATKDYIGISFTYFIIIAYFTKVKDKTFSYINCYFIERIIVMNFGLVNNTNC